MQSTTLVIGGCRSGKSRHALALAEQVAGDRMIFMATCVPHDGEMRDRIARHQAERGRSWQTLEVPIELPDKILAESRQADVILVDCLTLWVSNLLMEDTDLDLIEQRARDLSAALERVRCPLILVTNEAVSYTHLTLPTN